jgi:putative transposase
MSRSGSCLDNAAAESFFATLKTELIYRVVLVTRARARRQLIRWFDRYNRNRRHSHCGWRAPIAYENIDITARRAA